MGKFRSSYDLLMERLHKEDRIIEISSEVNFKIISDLNKEMAAGEHELRLKEVESERELANIVLTA